MSKFFEKLLNRIRGIGVSHDRKVLERNNPMGNSIKSRHLENLKGEVIRLEVSDLSGKKEVEIKGERFRLVFETKEEYNVGDKALIKFIYSDDKGR